MNKATGSCLCGTVKYSVNNALSSVGHCHCNMCQRYHGTAYSTYAMIPRDAFELTAGRDQLITYRSSEPVERSFCGNCGSPISYTHAESAEYIWLTAGTFDAELDCLPQYHIFVTDKAPWLEITDGLPQYPGLPPNH